MGWIVDILLVCTEFVSLEMGIFGLPARMSEWDIYPKTKIGR